MFVESGEMVLNGLSQKAKPRVRLRKNSIKIKLCLRLGEQTKMKILNCIFWMKILSCPKLRDGFGAVKSL